MGAMVANVRTAIRCRRQHNEIRLRSNFHGAPDTVRGREPPQPVAGATNAPGPCAGGRRRMGAAIKCARAVGAQGTKHDFMRHNRLRDSGGCLLCALASESASVRIKSVLFSARGPVRKGHDNLRSERSRRRQVGVSPCQVRAYHHAEASACRRAPSVSEYNGAEALKPNTWRLEGRRGIISAGAHRIGATPRKGRRAG
jgi:hypothetical protein